jgi:hypothetical protein
VQGGGESADAIAYALNVGPAAKALQLGAAAKEGAAPRMQGGGESAVAIAYAPHVGPAAKGRHPWWHSGR